MFSTLFVSNEETSISSKELQLLNIDAIFITFLVLKLYISNFLKEILPLNIPDISSTLLVSK